MRFDIMTLFPELVEYVLGESIMGRAQKSGAIEINTFNIRDYSEDKHRRVDDTPYGGGKGMLMMAPPIYNCFQAILDSFCEKHTSCEKTVELSPDVTETCTERLNKKIDVCSEPNKTKETIRRRVIYMSPTGKVLTQKRAVELARDFDNIVILCGHYEGVDRRIVDEIVDEEISIGDYILTGGEIPACILVDCVARMVDGVLSDKECYENESLTNNRLEYPQYTRPYDYHGMKVPDVLISGHHANIDKWRDESAERLTEKNRPDLLEKTKEG